MSIGQQPYFWKRMPFVRLIIPFIAGILLQWNFNFIPRFPLILAAVSILLLLVFSRFSLPVKFRLRWFPGAAINMVLMASGALILYNKDIRNRQDWVGNCNTDSVAVLATLQEPLVEKAKTYKVQARIDAININGTWKNVAGNVLLYFGKDSLPLTLHYGSQVLFYKQMQPIKNSGNPGNFDYKRYNAFQDIYAQVFLKSHEYIIAPTSDIVPFKQWLFNVRDWVIARLQKYIPGDREAGVAEALLIGYRNDLDRDLVQAYSNTGVVHIIAISGLHLGMIYGLLVLCLRPFRKTKWIKWVKPIIILTVLWIFTLLAGGVPSILRSAVMFSFIVLSEAIDRKSSILNTLASSAFVMLCYNPYFLWDIGFQLSYAAVVSIVLFSKPVNNWLFFKNKGIKFFWNLMSVTISAQILTMPIIFYAFHQFPNYFLITNCIIVPLSSVILFSELVLLVASLIPPVGLLVGKATGGLLWFMNFFIEWVNSLPFAVYDGIQNTLAQTILLYIFITCVCYWLLWRNRAAMYIAMAAIGIFILIDGYENYRLLQREKLIVYNIPQHSAIDFISAKKYAFVGDTALLADAYLRNFHLKPARTLNRITAANIEGLYVSEPFIQFQGKRILVIDKPYKFESDVRIPIDLIIISHNTRVRIEELQQAFDCHQYVFDGSDSPWKISEWKKECDALHLPSFSTQDEGAYEWKL